MADSADGLQFERAEFKGEAGSSLICHLCKNTIPQVYFSAGQATLCESCAARVKATVAQKPERADYLRGALWGAGAAIVGCLVWFLVVSLTGYQLALLAIGVGYLVGTAVRRGARRRGSRGMQVLAVVLTYVSIAGSFVPLIIQDAWRARGKQTQTDSNGVAKPQPADAKKDPEPRGLAAIPGIIFALGMLLAISLAAPFLQGAHGIIGLFIIAIGLWEAWKINRPSQVVVTGPFQITNVS